MITLLYFLLALGNFTVGMCATVSFIAIDNPKGFGSSLKIAEAFFAVANFASFIGLVMCIDSSPLTHW